MGNDKGVDIGVGDWVVAGLTRETREVGRIVSLEGDGDRAYVAWESGHRSTCDLSADDVEIFRKLEHAKAREAKLDALDLLHEGALERGSR